MSLPPGTRFGRYEVVSLLGAGGMGEVYRARDERLGREVAVKVLPQAVAADPERLRRFETEARAAGALNHANVMAVLDVGQEGGTPFVVSELLEGETLRERLARGIPVRKAIDLAAQIAHGLSAAHDKGIVHRDLKPENVFVTRDGRAKILDFGLAKLRARVSEADSVAPTGNPNTGTDSGTVLGTVGYMSPEQVRGGDVDHRSDVFALGAVLYEMLAGERAFARPTTPEVLTAILREDVPPPSGRNPEVGAALDRVVARCLDKQPDERFQSARDVAFALEAVGGSSASGVYLPVPRRRWRGALPAVLLAAGGVVAGVGFAARLNDRPVPSFQQVTFRATIMGMARFAPDGETVVYSVGSRRLGLELYSTRLGSRESRSLGLGSAHLLAISSAGELAVALNPKRTAGLLLDSTLARMPLSGGAPREVVDEVVGADWGPDGESLAVARRVETGWALEYPVGTKLLETKALIGNVRVSPDGSTVAYIEYPHRDHFQGSVAIVSRAGRDQRVLARDLFLCYGLAWSPDGREVWYSSLDGHGSSTVQAATRDARTRVVTRLPGWIQLADVSRAGRVLLDREEWRGRLVFGRKGVPEADLSWHDASYVADISEDGHTILFNETVFGGGTQSAVYLRGTDGSPAVRLGEGFGLALSPDGRWVLAIRRGTQARLAVLPTRAGEARQFEADPTADFRGAGWFPDSRRFAFARGTSDGAARLFVQDVEGGAALPTPVVGGDLRWPVVAPDAQTIAAMGDDGTIALYSLATGAATPLDGAEPGEVPLQWTRDGRALYTYQLDEIPIRISLVSRAGERRPWKEIALSGPSIAAHASVTINPDGTAWAYSYTDAPGELFVAEGLR